MSLRDAIVIVTHALAVPYGYTITIWSAGTLCIAKYGLPNIRQVVLFVLGASFGYLAFDWVTLSTNSTASGGFSIELPRAATYNFLAIVPALSIVVLTRGVGHKSLAFALCGFAASAVYIAALTLLIALFG